MRVAMLVLLTTMLGSAAAEEVELRAPLTTVVRIAAAVHAPDKIIEATVVVPADAPGDLGVGAFAVDRHGRWYQRVHPQALTPGRHQLRFALGRDDRLLGEPQSASWTAAAGATSERGGLFFWSATRSNAVIGIERLSLSAAERPAAAGEHHLGDLVVQGLDAAGIARGRTGERWTVTAMPSPFPVNPYAADQFRLTAVITCPDGREQRIPGFYQQPMAASDRGDHEEVTAAGAGTFAIRFRPRQPGRHQLRLEAEWPYAAGPVAVRCVLPVLDVSGPPWDDYARPDPVDPRFFSANSVFYWPIGLNLRSVWDLRSEERMGTRLTPDRGSLAYRAFLERLAAAGGTATEIWLSSWNLALEWRGDWPDFHGQGRYSEANAWRLDRILDDAWRLGIRVNLVVNNHGQASVNTDREWADNAYNRDNGGRLGDPAELFSDPWALAGQEQLRRYLVARYADHPALLGWKLWSEINLTAGDREQVRDWHAQAAARWHELDTYGHGVTTHWSGDFHTPDPRLVALPGLDYVCIDAYHGSVEDGGWMLAELLYQSINQPGRGLGQFRKPVLVTEYGGNWDAAPEAQLKAEHASGAWAALVSGHGGAPMLWWFEWVDQRGYWRPYGAVHRFLDGEDLRSPNARSIVLAATSNSGELWARAWSRPGRMLGYLLDTRWGGSGAASPRHRQTTVEIGGRIGAGQMTVEWWDADQGRLLDRATIAHPGGALTLKAPAFERHLGFKLYRSGNAADGAGNPGQTTSSTPPAPAH